MATTTTFVENVELCGTQAAPAAALTTVFTTPTFCPPIDQLATQPTPTIYACMPSNFSRYWDCPYGGGYYSPAICPAGYTAAAKRWQDQQGPDVTSGETAVLCCPSHYSTSTSLLSYCQNGTRLAFALQVRWKLSDIPYLATDPLTPDSNYFSTAATSATSLASPSLSSSFSLPQTSTTTKSLSARLGPGKSAGVAIGIIIPFLLIGAGIGFCIARMQRRRKRRLAEHGVRIARASQVLMEEADGPSSELRKEANESISVAVPYRPPNPHQDSKTAPPAGEMLRPAAPPYVSSTQPTQSADDEITPIPAQGSQVDRVEISRTRSTRDSGKQVVPPSDPEVVGESEQLAMLRAKQLARLREKQLRIQERRMEILRIRELDEEEERIKRQIAELERAKR